jgi:SAM-dependent methyltransferase
MRCSACLEGNSRWINMPRDTDRDWEIYGRTTPYFAVYADEKFLPENLDDAAREEFFASGERDIEWTVGLIHRYLTADFAPARTLDFGCGVGRLVFPLASRFPCVVGVDVSRSMLAEARRNCESLGLINVEFLLSDEDLSRVTGKFDFINSYIVMQHIPRARGEALFRRLLARLNPGGIGALHFTYTRDEWLRSVTPARRFARWLTESVPGCHGLVNLAKGRRFNHPFVQMNSYDLNVLFSILQEHGCKQVQAHFTNHTGHWGAMLLFQR